MSAPWILLLAIAALAIFYVLTPMMAEVFARYRKPRLLRCPETGETAAIQIDARHAATTSLAGAPDLRVADCSRWPERADCGQDCVASRV